MPGRRRPAPDHRREYAATLLGWLGRLCSTACLLSNSSALELFEKAGKMRIPARWRAPAHMRNPGVLAGKIYRKYFKSNVDHARRLSEQIARNVMVLFDHCFPVPVGGRTMHWRKMQRQYGPWEPCPVYLFKLDGRLTDLFLELRGGAFSRASIERVGRGRLPTLCNLQLESEENGLSPIDQNRPCLRFPRHCGPSRTT